MIIALTAVLAGCLHRHADQAASTTAPAGQKSKVQTAEARVGGAIISPLHDVNMLRTKIPDVLRDAMDAPYQPPSPRTCHEIADEIAPLDAALGPDLDRPVTPSNPSLVQRSEGMAGDAAVDALKSAAQSFIPMRDWVRKLSGAERHDKLVAAAIAAGAVRRAYLKGLGLSLSCEAPGAPTVEAQKAMPKWQRQNLAAPPPGP